MLRAKPVTFAAVWFVILFFGAAVFFPDYVVPRIWKIQDTNLGIAIWFLSLLLFGSGVISWVKWWLECKTNSLHVTSTHVKQRYGILRKHQVEIRLQNIQTVYLHQSLADRILRVGGIQVSSSGERHVEIKMFHIVNPNGIRDKIEQLS